MYNVKKFNSIKNSIEKNKSTIEIIIKVDTRTTENLAKRRLHGSLYGCCHSNIW